MGSMMFSTLSMFAPFWVQFVVFILICIGFRIYVSHEERKKRGGRANRKPKKQNKISTRENGQTRLEQLKVLRDTGLYTDQEYETKRQEILKK